MIGGCQISENMESPVRLSGKQITGPQPRVESLGYGLRLYSSHMFFMWYLMELIWGTTFWERWPRFSQRSRSLGHLLRRRAVCPLLFFQPKADLAPDHYGRVFVWRRFFLLCHTSWPVGLNSQVWDASAALRMLTSRYNRTIVLAFSVGQEGT